MQAKIRDRKVVDETLAKMNKPLKWLADEIGTDPSYLSKLLSGDRNPSPSQREKLMTTLGIDDWDNLFVLIGDIGEESQPMAL
jgi:transcriptional regulator with XRE-family HTH domain